MKEIQKDFNQERKIEKYEIRSTNEYKIIHMIEEGKTDYAISAKIIIPKDSKMIEKCKKYNKSPITQALEKIEKEHKNLIKDGKTEKNLYFD